MFIPHALVPKEIIIQYGLEALACKRMIYTEIQEGMYGLPQARNLANQQLTAYLAKYGYTLAQHTPGLGIHTTSDITVMLVANDFDICYTRKDDTLHLINALTNKDSTANDWSGIFFCGLCLDWDYAKKQWIY